jgi:alkaline phosphatase
MQKFYAAVLLLSMIPYYSWPQSYSPSNAHAHNDYVHPNPFFQAYDQGFGSIEADIFLAGDSLLVGHTLQDLPLRRTLNHLYLDPLAGEIRVHHGFPYMDSLVNLQLLIDIKTAAGPTLDRLVSVLENYSSIVHCRNLRIVITGNRPPSGTWGQYPDFIHFDGEWGLAYEPAALGRIPMFSGDWQDYTHWKGPGPLPDRERARLDSLISIAHGQGKKVRFWDAPDDPGAWRLLMALGVDYINTDKIDELSRFLRSQDQRRLK